MAEHPLDPAIVALCCVERGYEDEGMRFPGYLGTNLAQAFDDAHAWARLTGNLEAMCASGEIVEAEIALKRGEDLKMLDYVERAKDRLHALAGWPENVAGKTWTNGEKFYHSTSSGKTSPLCRWCEERPATLQDDLGRWSCERCNEHEPSVGEPDSEWEGDEIGRMER